MASNDSYRIDGTRYDMVTCEYCGHSYGVRANAGPLDGGDECRFCDKGGDPKNCYVRDCEACEAIAAQAAA